MELDLRTIKHSLGLEFLRAQSPDGVLRELWCGFLAYNLVRVRMLQSAASTKDRPARTLSFATTKSFLNASWSDHAVAGVDWIDAELARRFTLSDRNGHRPGRCEPRAVKRRSNPIALLMVSRQAWKLEQARARKVAA